MYLVIISTHSWHTNYIYDVKIKNIALYEESKISLSCRIRRNSITSRSTYRTHVMKITYILYKPILYSMWIVTNNDGSKESS